MKLLKHYGLVLLAAIFSFTYASAQTDAEQVGSIKVGALQGAVTLVNPDTGETFELTPDTVFTAPVTVVTTADSSVTLVLSNGAVLEIKPGSNIQVNLFSQQPFDPALGSYEGLAEDPSVSQVSINVVSGEIAANVGKLHSGSAFVVNTPTGTFEPDQAIVVIGFNPATSTTSAANISGNVAYEPNGGQPQTLPAGSGVDIPGTVDPATGVVTPGAPVERPVTPAESQAGSQVQTPPTTPTTPPSQPTTPPAAPSTTPVTDTQDLVDPTSTAPGSATLPPV